MKKIIVILLFIPFVCFGQYESIINSSPNVTYLGNGTYSMRARQYNNQTSTQIDNIVKFANSLDANLVLGSLTHSVATMRDYQVITSKFELRTKVGDNLVISKDEAKKELISLKEFLDLGIITQDEFNKKAVYLKKILLGK
ncbi:hypothetical protein N9H78_01880 [Winogradskyella sp.]|nr:hypothetical protein [Winogradskyella sp.]MDA8874404.1 hypothetical protein [Winogradskyella sp.]